MAERRVRVVQHGLGPIGRSVARLVTQRPSLALVGGLDPAFVGRDLGEVIGLERRLGIEVSDDTDALLASTGVDIVLNCTGSSLSAVAEHLEPIIKSGVDVISTCEELACPSDSGPARALDALARAHGATVLGTGVNPGFAMDSLPIMLTAACQQVRRIQVLRVVDASQRREPLQRKVGAGRSLSEFEQLVAAGRVRHVGMLESVRAIARALGWRLDRTAESIEPVIAERAIVTPYLQVEPGQVAGVHQFGRGYRDGQEVITLELAMYVGAPESVDRIRIEGTPDLENELHGLHGDLATAAVVVNCIPQVLAARPGLLTMADLALPHACS
ncbi:MAG: dihydrodipicolinate reductase [Anaerolineae bacterium]|nr:dihydrodipicolinate reductase [Anaerolineae bacterium]